jgi:excisionase family DNA binding protein
MHERWLSEGDSAAYQGVNADTVYNWIDRKKMPTHSLGRLWKCLASEEDAWGKAGKAGGSYK